MDTNIIPIDWFVCPLSLEPLKREGNFLKSSAAKYAYSDDGNFWDFTPYSATELKRKEWSVWEKLQDNGVVSYKEDPSKNLGVGARKDHLEFRDFVGFKGKILDIGVGPQKSPSHVEHSSPQETGEFVGIDPLTGDIPKNYKFVKGLGEFLPFRDDFFAKTLFVTSLDHFVDPMVALRSAARVTSKNGEICIWMGEKSKDAPKPKMSAEWYEKLEVPIGAEDRFHMKRFGVPEMQKMAETLNLKTKEHRKLKIDEWRTSHFFKLTK